MSNKQHYYLVSGTVYVKMENPENPEDYGVMPVPVHCTVFSTVSPNFGVQMLKQAHTALQIQYRHKTNDQENVILDVVFNAVSPLGLMSAEEFSQTDAPDKEAVADIQEIIDRRAVTRHNSK